MKHFLSIIFLYVVLAVPAFAQPAPTSLAGNWLGTLEIGGIKLRVVLNVEKVEEGYAAKFERIDQGARDLPIDSITLSGNKMNLTAPRLGMTYEGTLNDMHDEISGTFKQGAGSTPFVFKRTAELPVTTRALNNWWRPALVRRPVSLMELERRDDNWSRSLTTVVRWKQNDPTCRVQH